MPASRLALLVLLAPSLSRAGDLAARSRIDAVAVYRSSARVTRIAHLELPAGDTRVALAGLPEGIDDDSVRVEGRGAAPARIFGVAVERVTAGEARDAEARDALAALEALQDEDRSLEDRIRVAQGRQRFVESLRSTYAEERAKNLAVRGVSAREWADLAGFVEGQLTASAAEVRRAEVARRGLGGRIEATRAQLEKLRAKRSATSKTVRVELRAERPGGFDLAVTYGVPSASWEPIWDARLLVERAQVELDLLGAVRNASGEDWSDVRLSVSTAQPSRRLLVPQLEPRWLQRHPPPRPVVGAVGLANAGRLAAPEAAAPSTPAALPEEAKELRAELVQSTVEEGFLAATFTAARRESVDGSGQARRVALQRFTLPASVSRVAAPRLDPAAFLAAKLVNDTGVPLLAGSAGVWLGDEFVGRAPLAATPPGGELELAFGVDPRVEVERRVLERRHETSGLISTDDVLRYHVRITVKNRWPSQVAVKLLDLVPVSREEAIRVKVLEGTTPAADDPDRPGVRVHALQLAAREERVVELRYEVRMPRNFPAVGLE